jgi:hypothetical protein
MKVSDLITLLQLVDNKDKELFIYGEATPSMKMDELFDSVDLYSVDLWGGG